MFNRKVDANTVVTYLGAFGCPLSKPTRLKSNCRFLPTLVRFPPADTDLQARQQFYTVRAGGRVSGRSGLASSATYPPAFADAMIDSYLKSYLFMLLEPTAHIDDDTSSVSSIELDGQ